MVLGSGKTIEAEYGLDGRQLPMDVLAEAAFWLASQSTVRGTKVAELGGDPNACAAAWKWAVARIAAFRLAPAATPKLEQSVDYLRALCDRYDQFIGVYSRGGLSFGELVPGCGFLSECQIDISSGESIIEVKAVDRGFAAKDIRQLIIYLAIDYCSGRRRWTAAALFNPRRNKLAEFDPARFISYVSGGRHASEIYREIEEFVLSREDDLMRAF
jgi:hypothetical protein